MTTVQMERSELSSYGHSAVYYNKVSIAEPTTQSNAYLIPPADIFAIGFDCTPNGDVEFTMAAAEAIVDDTADWYPAQSNSPVNHAVTAWRLVRSATAAGTGTVTGSVTIKGVLQ